MRKDSKTTISDLEKENRHLKEQLKEKIEFYENLLALMPGHVYWLDTNNVYLGCNNQQADVLKLESREKIVGKRNKDLLWVDQASQYDEANLKVLRSGERVKTKEMVPVNGELKTFLTEKIPLKKSNDESIGILGISIDITDLENTKKKAEQASIAKSKFIANMSHDIRTPLTGIVGLSDMLFDTAIKAETKEYAKMLHLSGEQLLSLLNSVLEIVSSESINQDTVELSSFELADLLHNIFELELPALKLKDLTLELKMDDDIPAIIKTDKGKLYRILLNLLSNSIKFTEKGSIIIQVSNMDSGDKQANLCFDILDTGIGIPKTETDKIFNAFYRVHPSYEGKYQGFGVGLHLVKQYVGALKGDISVNSIEGMGTRFHLILPVEIPQEEINHPIEESKKQTLQHTIDEINNPEKSAESIIDTSKPDLTKSCSDSTSAHILLVEDNPMAMIVADMILTKQGATTDKAYNSLDALNLFKKNRYNLVITDIGLPDFSGFELTQKIKAFEKEKNVTSPTPIIGLTAHAKQEALLQGNQCGMLDVCEKPLTEKGAMTYIDMFGKNKASFHAEKSGEYTTTPSPNIPLLDVDLGISQLGSIDDFKKMLDIMLKQTMVTSVDEIDKYYQACDWDLFKREVHKFKSSCLYCATTKLLKLTQNLESLADTKDSNQIKPVYQKFSDCVISTGQYIESYLSMKNK